MLTRRAVMLGTAAAGVAAVSPSALGEILPQVDPLPADAPVRRLTLAAGEMDVPLLGPGRPATRRFCAYNGIPLMQVRAPKGTRLLVDFENRLPAATTVHWHGIRVPNAFDGVAPLTQAVVPPGGRFSYNVPLPDAGFYFFHPHCDETGQVGRGLAALLLVDEPASQKVAFDLEHIIVVKDFRLGEDGQFLPAFTDEGASTAGTFGNVRATNGQIVPPRVEAPAFGDVRVRAIVADSTRVIDLGCDTEEALLLACDGQPIPPIAFAKLPDEVWRMGPAMRADLQVRMPAPGGEVKIYDYRSSEPYLLTTLVAVDRGLRKTPFRARPLPPSKEVPMPDVARAERLDFLIQTAAGATITAPALPGNDPLAKALVDSVCVGDKTLWAINQTSWAAGADLRLPPPLATLRHGGSYILRMTNVSKHVHPMHLHGHVFRVLSSSRRKAMPQVLADTINVEPNETLEIAFKATRGDWVFHCHILEHMDTGLMGWFRVV